MPTADNHTQPMKTPDAAEHEVSARLLGSELTLHPCAQAIPMTPEEFAVLLTEIQRIGQKVPIIVDAHYRIVDGVHRYRACIKLGIEPIIDRRELSDAEAWALSLSANVVRRQMSETQRAAACAMVRKSENFPLTQVELAKVFRVSDRLVRGAERVLEASPDLFEMLKADQLTVNAAKEILSLTPAQRGDAMERLKRGDVAAARAKLKKTTRPRASQATSQRQWRKKQACAWHAAYAPLYAAADELPQLLIDHPLSPEHLKELADALKQAILLVESASSK